MNCHCNYTGVCGSVKLLIKKHFGKYQTNLRFKFIFKIKIESCACYIAVYSTLNVALHLVELAMNIILCIM